MQLLETIHFDSGVFSNLELHNKRMNDSRKALFNRDDEINLELSLNKFAIKIRSRELFKCRVVYDTQIRSIEFVPYKIPKINSLKIVSCNNIEYSHKYAVRDEINKLMAQKGNADDIIILKNGLITDSSFANLLFYNGKQWLTPAFPLLVGTQRTKLLESNRIITTDIKPTHIPNFTKARLINAMIRFEDAVDIVVDNIW